MSANSSSFVPSVSGPAEGDAEDGSGDINGTLDVSVGHRKRPAQQVFILLDKNLVFSSLLYKTQCKSSCE